MKRIVLSLITASLGAVSSLQAAPLISCCCGSFEVGGQAIYLRPTSCDFDYVIVDDRPFTNFAETQAHLPQKKARNVDPDYDWGFRVSIGYVTESNCNDVRVEYTYLRSHDKSTVGPLPVGGQGIWPVYAHPLYINTAPWYSTDIPDPDFFAQARSDLRFDYDAADLQFGSRSLQGCNLWLRSYAGLHFMNLDHRQSAFYQGSSNPTDTGDTPVNFTDVSWHKNTWGIGPLFGLDARYVIACNFGFGAHVGAGILAGETDGKMRERDLRIEGVTTVVDETLDVRRDNHNVLFPYLRASLGINYWWCCGNYLDVLIEFGYEFHSYINTIGHFRFNDQRATGMANCYSFNLDGLYLSVRVTL